LGSQLDGFVAGVARIGLCRLVAAALVPRRAPPAAEQPLNQIGGLLFRDS
jgi:hypothetical protein